MKENMEIPKENSISNQVRRITMSTNVYDILQERGFIEQCTHEDEVRELLGKESVTFI